eukprot:jgi/Hompol1/3995/HPOL_000691-RA
MADNRSVDGDEDDDHRFDSDASDWDVADETETAVDDASTIVGRLRRATLSSITIDTGCDDANSTLIDPLLMPLFHKLIACGV